MAVTLPPTPQPSTSLGRDEFIDAMDEFVAWMYTAVPEMDAAITALNLAATNGTSATSVAIGTGSKSFTANVSKSWVVGMTLKLANSATNWMLGEVSSYNAGTGALVINVRRVMGSGTFASWTISLASDDAGLEDHEVIVHTGNGYGSTNTKIRRFTTILQNVGSSITYADSATLGGSFTINDTGVYAMYYQDVGQDVHAITRNATGTANPSLTNTSQLLAVSSTTGTANKSVSRVAKLTAGDVVRAHTNGGSTDTTAAVLFSIRRLS